VHAAVLRAVANMHGFIVNVRSERGQNAHFSSCCVNTLTNLEEGLALRREATSLGGAERHGAGSEGHGWAHGAAQELNAAQPGDWILKAPGDHHEDDDVRVTSHQKLSDGDHSSVGRVHV
jgi:hypothetical protein